MARKTYGIVAHLFLILSMMISIMMTVMMINDMCIITGVILVLCIIKYDAKV